MPGIARFKRIQIGAESPPGTAVPATTIWRGKGVPEDLREVTFVPEDVGIIAPTDRSYIAKLGAQLVMEETPVTFQQLCYILMAGIKSVTGQADDGGSDYIYTFPISIATANTPKTYTLEGGDDQQAVEIEYCIVPDFRIVGASDEALRMQATWIGRQITDTTFTPSLSLPAVEEALFNKGKLFIDASEGTHGTTEKSGTMVSADLKVTTGFKAYKGADGTLYFTAHSQGEPEVLLDLGMLHDAAAEAEITAWKAETIRLIQLLFEGSQFTTPGTTYTYHTVAINLTGKWESFTGLEEQDANNKITGTFRAVYNATDAHYAEIIVANELSALP